MSYIPPLNLLIREGVITLTKCASQLWLAPKMVPFWNWTLNHPQYLVTEIV